ncbi:Excalibur calcium-binding domain containing protein [Candidatus Planktophila dulcis]|uniref:excalibur calcium-binding domain-containing protein n=1 Tax=Candidatus Planktophila dulcis TaxID=1884914 RepID=UPI003CF1770F
MRKVASLALVLALSCVGLTPVSAASAPKPGTNCTKAGLTQTIAGKKYTCTKSGTKLTWNKGVTIASKVTPSTTAIPESSPTTVQSSATPNPTVTLVKFKNCTEVKAAGAAPLVKTINPELYELNAGLDRDKDGIACES